MNDDGRSREARRADRNVVTRSLDGGRRPARAAARPKFDTCPLRERAYFSILVDEWRTARERTARVRSALASIRAELESNRTAIADAITNHQTVIAKRREASGPGEIYQGSIISNPGFSVVAWGAARDGAITNDIDHLTLVTLGHAYTALSDYMDDRRVFTNYLYTNPTPDLRQNPQGVAGWLNDMSGRAKRVERRLDAALQTLPPP